MFNEFFNKKSQRKVLKKAGQESVSARFFLLNEDNADVFFNQSYLSKKDLKKLTVLANKYEGGAELLGKAMSVFDVINYEQGNQLAEKLQKLPLVEESKEV